MHTPEDSEMPINTQTLEEYSKSNTKPKKYILVPIEDPKNHFVSFNIILDEDYPEIEKLKEKALKKTI